MKRDDLAVDIYPDHPVVEFIGSLTSSSSVNEGDSSGFFEATGSWIKQFSGNSFKSR
jgi:hypothetical protein